MSNEYAPTALSKVPEDVNFLSRSGFKLLIKKLPYTNFFVQKINLPGISLNTVNQPNPFVNTPHTGDHIDYEHLAVTFKVDEELKNYIEIHDWIKGSGFPNNFKEYRDLAAEDKIINHNIESDISLFILTSHRNASHEIIFREAKPISLTELEFDSTAGDIDYLEATAMFQYTSYKITTVT